mmetsp:Transcript_25345/g.83838  ORF Transcript_25345/g.83838 Transcript_25345/m.83838 type:complete len:296 (+) Transcript_25345:697-1584(+)
MSFLSCCSRVFAACSLLWYSSFRYLSTSPSLCCRAAACSMTCRCFFSNRTSSSSTLICRFIVFISSNKSTSFSRLHFDPFAPPLPSEGFLHPISTSCFWILSTCPCSLRASSCLSFALLSAFVAPRFAFSSSFSSSSCLLENRFTSLLRSARAPVFFEAPSSSLRFLFSFSTCCSSFFTDPFITLRDADNSFAPSCSLLAFFFALLSSAMSDSSLSSCRFTTWDVASSDLSSRLATFSILLAFSSSSSSVSARSRAILTNFACSLSSLPSSSFSSSAFLAKSLARCSAWFIISLA